MKQKKGVSLMIAYVLLVTIGIALALLVYGWLKFYVSGEDETQFCPEETRLIIKEYKYDDTTGELDITVQNKGLFIVRGYSIKVHNRTGATSGFYTLYDNNVTLLPGDEDDGGSPYDVGEYGTLTFVEVQPYITSDDEEIVLCQGTSSVKPVQYVAGEIPSEGCYDSDHGGDLIDQYESLGGITIDGTFIINDFCTDNMLTEHDCNDSSPIGYDPIEYDCTELGSDWVCFEGECTDDPGSQEFCTDSDPTNNHYFRGNVTDAEGTAWDFCFTNSPTGFSDAVSETVCDGDSRSSLYPYLCPHGCDQGKCILDCSDSDPDDDLYKKGRVFDRNGTIKRDYCLESKDLRQYGCDPLTKKWTVEPQESCPGTEACEDGRCVMECQFAAQCPDPIEVPRIQCQKSETDDSWKLEYEERGGGYSCTYDPDVYCGVDNTCVYDSNQECTLCDQGFGCDTFSGLCSESICFDTDPDDDPDIIGKVTAYHENIDYIPPIFDSCYGADEVVQVYCGADDRPSYAWNSKTVCLNGCFDGRCAECRADSDCGVSTTETVCSLSQGLIRSCIDSHIFQCNSGVCEESNSNECITCGPDEIWVSYLGCYQDTDFNFDDYCEYGVSNPYPGYPAVDEYGCFLNGENCYWDSSAGRCMVDHETFCD